MHSGLFHSIDFDADGRQETVLSIPFSIDRSPYYQVQVPVVRLRNGAGPRVLLMAGNHGDEYEGNIALSRLSRALAPQDIHGEVTILPFVNAPAFMAGRRRSPLDNGNLNRTFPGDPNGTPTQRIAYFLEHELFPRHDIVFDLHSGGTSMAHLPTSLIEKQGGSEHFSRMLALMRALGMPYGFIAENGADAPTSLAAIARAGAIGLSGEFGGGGTVTPTSMRLTLSAIDNLLMAVEVTRRPMLIKEPSREATRLLSLSSHAQAIYARRPGWFEPANEIGDAVSHGDVAGWFHDFHRLEAVEETLRYAQGGIVLSQRLHSMSEAGDCLVQVGVAYDEGQTVS